MRAGREVIHQACFLHEGWVGYADFLVRIEEPSDLGSWSYEVHDAKFARHPKPHYIFQLLFYTEQVERIQGLRPKRMHLILGDGERPPFPPEEFDAYAAQVRTRFLARRGELVAGATPAYPYPVPDCDFCPYWRHCRDRRRADDHLSLVASLSRPQGLKLEDEGVHSVAALAALPANSKVTSLAGATLDGLREQADFSCAAAACRFHCTSSTRSRCMAAGSPACPIPHRATSSSTSRATRIGARRGSSTCSEPSLATTLGSGPTGPGGHTTKPRRSARLKSGWTGLSRDWRDIRTSTSFTTTTTSRRH